MAASMANQLSNNTGALHQRAAPFYFFLYRYPLTMQQKTDTITQVMKSSIHPTDYRPVVFSDEAAGFAFLTQSTIKTEDTIKWEDGSTYPLVKVPVSSKSHPFFTGEEKIIDTEGRVDRFKARFAAAEERKQALANKAKKASTTTKKKAKTDEKSK